MNVQKHITGIKGLEAYDAAILKAAQKPGKAVRVQAGWYVAVAGDDLVEIQQRNDADSCLGWWDFHEVQMKWVGDTQPTLAAVKEALQIQ